MKPGDRRPTGTASSPTREQREGQASERQRERARRIELLSRTEELEVEVDRLVQGGLGLALWQRIPLLIEGAAPNERVRVRLTERRPDYARAEIVEILRASPVRVEPPCPYYDRCGGCDLQHIDPDQQLALKVAAAREALARLGGIGDLPPAETIAGEMFAYRSRAQVHVAIEADAEGAEAADDVSSRYLGRSQRPDVRIGFRQRRSDAVVDVDHCLVLTPTLQSALTQVRQVVHRQLPGTGAPAPDRREDGEETASPNLPKRLDVLAGDGQRWVMAPLLDELPRGEVTISVDVNGREYALRSHASVFFQSNVQLAGRLAAVALRGCLPGPTDDVATADAASAAGETIEVAWDLYAGVGLFTLPLLRGAQQVVAVEGDRAAARHLRYNARKFDSARLRVAAESVETFLNKELRNPSPSPQLVVVDPPRTGLTKLVRAALLHVRPRRLRYVSCDPATLARDLRVLSEHYRVVDVAFVDLFPQTSHLESVVALEAVD